nr:hypothetical protein [Paraburkholderia fungorum]
MRVTGVIVVVIMLVASMGMTVAACVLIMVVVVTTGMTCLDSLCGGRRWRWRHAGFLPWFVV